MRIAQWIGLWALLLVCSIVAPGVADADWKIDRAKAVAAKAWSDPCPGRVQILTYAPSTRLALTRRAGTGRVAWRAGDGLPVVQCVRVRRDGPLTGAAVELLSVSAPIASDGSCAS